MTTFVSLVSFEKLQIPCDLGKGEWWNYWVEINGDVLHNCFGGNQLLGIFKDVESAKKMVLKDPVAVCDSSYPYILICEYEFGLSPSPTNMLIYKWNDDAGFFEEIDSSYLKHIGFFGFLFF